MIEHRLKNLHVAPPVIILASVVLGISGASAQYVDLHDFDTPSLASPQYSGILAQGRDGNIYGTAPLGGTSGRGGVFKITPAGVYSAIYSFDGTFGSNPYSGLTLASDGAFLGTAYNNGTGGFGTAFRITPGAIVTALHNFVLLDGAGPYAPPIEGTDGNYYGVTSIGGVGGVGSVYKVTPGGAYSVLYHFDVTHGSTPIAPLIQGTDGSFYGTTKIGGAFGFGTAFRITPAGTLTVLYDFDATHGSNPYAPLVQGSDGNFYGTARNGGTLNNGGVAFKLTPAKVLTILHNFDQTSSTPDGNLPYGGLVQASDGNFYGVTSAGGTNRAGTLYELTLGGGYLKLYDFVPATGSLPYTTLRQHTNGVLYGEATSGGAAGHGVLFSFRLGTSVQPFVALQSASGRVGKVVGILGGGFTGTTGVKFNGTSATFSVLSGTYIAASVPAGASTGFVTVAAPGGPLRSNQKFRVSPVILSFTPSGGPVGTSVTITGNSLTGATKVTFGGTRSTTFTVDSSTQITAIVPIGAVTGKIQVTTQGGTATTSTVFTVN